MARPAICLILLAVVLEMTLGGGATLRTLNANEYFTAHTDYVDNDVTRAIQKAVDRAEEIGDAEMEGAFYRMEFAPRRTFVDTALFGYRGITLFSSSNYYTTTKFLGNVGYEINGVNSHTFRNFVPALDSLMGLRYVVLQNSGRDGTRRPAWGWKSWIPSPRGTIPMIFTAIPTRCPLPSPCSPAWGTGDPPGITPLKRRTASIP